MDLSILIPARNEMFLKQTVENILKNIRGNTEIIVVLDGATADPKLEDNSKLHVINHSTSIGQRAATNEAATISTAEFIMKLDAHCAVDEGFDVKLMSNCEPKWTVIPRMYNLHAFDWVCKTCGNRTYQGPTLKECAKCKGIEIYRDILWKPRFNRETDFARFDSSLHFQYWTDYRKRPEAQGAISDVMCCVGAGWFMRRKRYWEIEGMDENHGSWGQMGVELACKSWLSGGRQVVNKNTWFAHMFRTQGGDFGFPYHQPGRAVEHARKYSRNMWEGNNWSLAIRPFNWILNKFKPIPDWPEPEPLPTKGIVYYTDNRGDPAILETVRKKIDTSRNGHELVSVSLQPIDFGKNITLPLERSRLAMFKQILAGLETCSSDVVFLCEHDVLYHPSHFDFIPPRKDVYYYNENVYKVDAKTGQAVFYWTKQTSGLCAYRELLLEHYRKRVAKVEAEGYDHSLGYEPGNHPPPRGLDNVPAKRWMSEVPNVDIRHGCNLTATRWDPSQFRDKNTCLGWTLVDEIPGWGVTKGRFTEFLAGVGA